MANKKSQISSLSMKLVCINAKGLTIPEKRSQLLKVFSSMKANIVCIQETHFKSDKIPKFTDNRFPLEYHATNPESLSLQLPTT